MSPEEFRAYQLALKPVKIKVSELQNKEERTLVYGYTCDRLTFHVFLLHGTIHRSVYAWDDGPSIKQATEWDPAELVPDKRAYPESTDFEFASLMAAKGHPLPLIWKFDETRWGHVNGLRFVGSISPFS